MREAAFRAEAAAGLARSRRDAVRARERLVRAAGLDATSAARLALPDRLPDVPDALPDDDTALEALALRERFDLQAARFEVDALARSLGFTRATRFVNVLDLGPATVMEDGSPMKKGYEISLELPLFDWGTARVAKAEGLYRQALAQVAAIAVDARSEVREAAAARREAHAVAVGLRDELVPLRQQILDETLLRTNGMLESVFALVADVRAQVDAVNGALAAQRDWWLADLELRRAIGGRVPPGPVLAPSMPAEPVSAAPASPKGAPRASDIRALPGPGRAAPPAHDHESHH
jgi:outer membrane protein TolC